MQQLNNEQHIDDAVDNVFDDVNDSVSKLSIISLLSEHISYNIIAEFKK